LAFAQYRPGRLLGLALLLCCCADAPGSCLVVSGGAARATALRAAGSALEPSHLASRSRRQVTPMMMAKKVTKMIKLAIPAGKANPAPPIGPALGAAGVNIMMFCKEYNARTADKAGTIVPAEISVYDDRSFSFILKTPPTSELLKKAVGVAKGSGTPFGRGGVRVGTITKEQVEEIAKIKLPDLNTNKLESAMATVGGTARNMGIDVEE